MEWGCDITKTCPITLLETTRKAFVKIITNCLSSIIAKHKICKGNNFAGLPGGSTEDPIKIMNILIEDAIENKKDIWILLQDLSKAYDRVDLKFLKLALQRIKLPTLASTLIINLFTARKNAILTSDRISSYYDVKIGIDQGEVISPLLWCIYLDPLLCEINSLNKGYTINHTWISDLTDNSTTTLSESVSSLAFMDDTNWIANSQTDLECILDVADDFYNLTRAALNKDKSKLLVTNFTLSSPVNLRFGSSHIDITPETESVRFLGVWINSQRSQSFVKNQIRQDINKFVNSIKYKPVTDKQMAYIINMVLCPLLEYRMQITPLSKNECDILFAPIRSLFKAKLHFSSTLPTVLLHLKYFYNLNNLWSLQTQSISTAILNQFNNNTIYKKISTIRLFQLQSLNMLATSPLDHWHHSFNCKSYKNLIGASLSLISHCSKQVSCLCSPTLKNQIIGGTNSLYKIIPINDFIRHNYILKKHNLFYLDQLTAFTGRHLISWADFLYRDFNHSSTKIRHSKFLPLLESIVLANSLENLLKEEFFLDYLPKYLNLAKPLMLADRKKEFVSIWNPSNTELVFGQIVNKNIKPDEFIIQHYIYLSENNIERLVKCEGCIRFPSTPYYDFCNFAMAKHKVVEVLITPKSTRTVSHQLRHSLHEITRVVHSHSFCNIPNTPSSSQDLIAQIFPDSSYHDQLRSITSEISTCKHLSFYTDGSLSASKTDQCKMGIGWICYTDLNSQLMFNASIEYWPSSTRAEIFAILSALIISPKHLTIQIYTDSQTTIHGFYSHITQQSFSIRTKEKTANYTLWYLIQHIMESSELQVYLHKVKAHNGDLSNDMADSLAKAGCDLPPLSPSLVYTP